MVFFFNYNIDCIDNHDIGELSATSTPRGTDDNPTSTLPPIPNEGKPLHQRHSSISGQLQHLVFKQIYGNETPLLINNILLFITKIIKSITLKENMPETTIHLYGIVEPLVMRGSSVLLTGSAPLLLTITLSSPSLKHQTLKTCISRLISAMKQCNVTGTTVLLSSITELILKFNDLIMDYVKGISPVCKYSSNVFIDFWNNSHLSQLLYDSVTQVIKSEMNLSDDQSFYSSGSREILLSLYNTFYDIDQNKLTCPKEV